MDETKLLNFLQREQRAQAVVEQRQAINGLADWRHRARHAALHSTFSELVAAYLNGHPNKRSATTTVQELMRWSYEQTQNPDLGKANS
jgi:hypothetical protein